MINPRPMKRLISTLIISALAIPALANPKDRNYKYCDDITTVDKLLDRTRESVERIQREKLNIDRVVVDKTRRELYLVSGGTLLRKYDVAFGWDDLGHKRFEGDGRTPEGIYNIDYKNPQSAFNLSLHIDYPNKADREFAASKGRSPGGQIMIHGLPNNPASYNRVINIHPMNWTAGCIAVTNEQIKEVYTLVKAPTLVEICKFRTANP